MTWIGMMWIIFGGSSIALLLHCIAYNVEEVEGFGTWVWFVVSLSSVVCLAIVSGVLANHPIGISKGIIITLVSIWVIIETGIGRLWYVLFDDWGNLTKLRWCLAYAPSPIKLIYGAYNLAVAIPIWFHAVGKTVSKFIKHTMQTVDNDYEDRFGK